MDVELALDQPPKLLRSKDISKYLESFCAKFFEILNLGLKDSIENGNGIRQYIIYTFFGLDHKKPILEQIETFVYGQPIVKLSSSEPLVFDILKKEYLLRYKEYNNKTLPEKINILINYLRNEILFGGGPGGFAELLYLNGESLDLFFYQLEKIPDGQNASVNIIVEDLFKVWFLQKLQQVVKDKSLSGRLCIEILETETNHSNEEICRVLNSVKEMGIKLAMDDRPMSYSTDERLRLFLKNNLLGILKVDGKYLKNIYELYKEDSENVYVKNFISFIKELISDNNNIDIVFEWVSSEEVFNFLYKNFSEFSDKIYYQGFWISDQIKKQE